MTDLRNARIIEVGTPEQNGILIRGRRGDPFTRIGGVAEGEAEVDQTPLKHHEDKLRRNDQMTVLATFPLALADLIPEGCTEFRCKTNGFGHLVATKLPSGSWASTSHTSAFPNLDVLAKACRVDLNTVVPLAVHPDYIEARR